MSQVSENKRVYVDESGCNQCYGRQYGYAPRGVRVEDVRQGCRFGRTNVLAGYCNGEMLAPIVYKHTTNSTFFEAWFEFDLLSVVPCGYTIIMDNASFHRKKALRKIAERYGVKLLFLPPYSPDYNPIEKFWANMKKWLAKNVSLFSSLSKAIIDFCVRKLF